MSYSYSQDFSSTVRHITIPKPSIQQSSLELSSIAQVEGHYIEVRRRISGVRDISNFERIAENHISEESKKSMNDSESLVQVKASEKEEISGEQILWQVEQSLTSIRVEQLRNEVRPNSSIRSIKSLYQQQIPRKSRTLPGYSLDSQILLDLSCKLSVVKEVTIVKKEVVNLLNFKNEQTDCFCIAQSLIEIILEKAFEQVTEKLPIKAGFQGFDSGMYAVDACLEQFLSKNELSIRKQLKHQLNSAQTDTHLDFNDTNQPLSQNPLESIHTRLIHHALKETLSNNLRNLPQIPSSLLDMKITQLLYDSTRQVQECTRFFGGALPHSELLQEYGITERLEGEKLGALRDERLEMIMEAECVRMVKEDKREMEEEVERVVREIGEAIMGELVQETVDILNNK
ncbi:hypothetical protein FGO68_gene6939 [Halteria grandinella]|uniref:DUF4378 domain-containing protein n=1 Tax=Halteria grandinella TaxID=5974 RepID=A0A8J8T5N7_HALGN|nr:hypothetical protein FGO68_gene6939 [Halteria grandinella]